MFPDFLFLSNPSSEYQQVLQNFMGKNRFQINAKQHHTQQLLNLAMNQKYIDSPLTKNSLQKISDIKNNLIKFPQFQTIIVAPLRKSMQTCYEIFKQYYSSSKNQKIINKKFNFYIQPLLADQLNSSSAIGDLNQQNHPDQYKQFKQFYQNFKVIQKSQWIYDILPNKIKNQLQNNVGLTSGKKYLKFIQQNKLSKLSKQSKCFQTKLQFCQRIKQLKLKLLNYQKISGNNKKVLIIASSQFLNVLASTDFHQNGQPVNPMRINNGQVHLVHLVIQGQKILKSLDHQFNIPFCNIGL